VLWERVVQRRLENVVTDRIVMPRSEFYNEFLKPQGGEEILISTAVKRAESGTTLTRWRPQRLGT